MRPSHWAPRHRLGGPSELPPKSPISPRLAHQAVFKCPDGYAGSYPERVERQGGYEDFTCGHNPFSNKIVLLDEVHRTTCSLWPRALATSNSNPNPNPEP